MSCLEKIRPFFRYCQLIGFFPFRMEFEKPSQRFKNFSFSWHYPVTWWFVLFSLVHYVSYYYFTNQLSKNKIINNLPFLVYATVTTVIVIYIVFMVFSRYVITFRFSSLHNAIEFMRLAESTLMKGEHPDFKNTLTLRMIVGLIISFTWMFSSMSVVYILIMDDMVQEFGFFTSFIFLLMTGFMVLLTGCAFVSFHLVYYLMSYYIKVLGYRLTADNENISNNVSTGLNKRTMQFDLDLGTPTKFAKNLRKRQREFSYICKATREWNNIFSFPVLIVLAAKVVTSTFSSFAFIKGMFLSDVFLTPFHWFLLIVFSLDFIMMSTVFIAADMPVQEAVRLREKIIRICNFELMHSTTHELMQGISFLEQVSEDRLRLSTGLFSVGVHLVPSITGSIVTYLVILLQTRGY